MPWVRHQAEEGLTPDVQAYFRKNPRNFVQLFLIIEMEFFRFSGVHVS